MDFCGHRLRNSIEFIIKDVSGTGKQVKNKLIDEKIQNDIYIFVVFMQHVCFRKITDKKDGAFNLTQWDLERYIFSEYLRILNTLPVKCRIVHQ